MSAPLRSADLRRLGAATEALLSPLAGPSPEGWQQQVAAAMRELFGVTHAMFVIPECGRARFLCDTADAATLRRLVELTTAEEGSGRLRARDPLVDAWFQRRSAERVEVYNEALNDRMLDHRLERSVMVMDVLRPGGFHDFLGFMTACGGHELMLFMGQERRARSRFGEDELTVLGALLPAFRAGHHALATFSARRVALASTLDAMGEAVMVVGTDGREAHRNAALRRALAADPDRERLAGEMLAAGQALGAAQRSGACVLHLLASRGGGAPGLVREVTTPLGRYTVRVCTLPADLFGEGGGVLVSLDGGAGRVPSASDVAERFGLTPREAEVALALARRLTNAELARALGISPHTALRHTERVLAKLGLHSRREVPARLGVDAAPAPGGAGVPALPSAA